eukprot:scaffold40072_cov25-Tisochrysis_lutea.AAC.4
MGIFSPAALASVRTSPASFSASANCEHMSCLSVRITFVCARIVPTAVLRGARCSCSVAAIMASFPASCPSSSSAHDACPEAAPPALFSKGDVPTCTHLFSLITGSIRGHRREVAVRTRCRMRQGPFPTRILYGRRSLSVGLPIKRCLLVALLQRPSVNERPTSGNLRGSLRGTVEEKGCVDAHASAPCCGMTGRAACIGGETNATNDPHADGCEACSTRDGLMPPLGCRVAACSGTWMGAENGNCCIEGRGCGCAMMHGTAGAAENKQAARCCTGICVTGRCTDLTFATAGVPIAKAAGHAWHGGKIVGYTHATQAGGCGWSCGAQPCLHESGGRCGIAPEGPELQLGIAIACECG